MQKDENGIWIMDEGDIFSTAQDPNLSGPPFQVTKLGDGDWVEMTGFGFGDPTRVKTRALSVVRGVYTNYEPNTGAGPDADAAVRVMLRGYASVVQGNGQKLSMGQIPESK